MYFEQIIEKETSTYTYLLADEKTKEAILIDPVLSELQYYLDKIMNMGFKLKYTVDTHVHADHITASGKLKESLDCEYIIHEKANIKCSLKGVKDKSAYSFGDIEFKILYTPGHTDHHISILVGERVFTGDCLFINGCGRTDFQGGSPEEQWNSITNVLYSLYPDTLVYPGHDYKKIRVSSIAQEKEINNRIVGHTKETFIEQMNNLNLNEPKHIHQAVPANLNCGM